MKTFTLTQAQKQHNVNALHDAFIAAGVVPVRVESSDVESRFGFDDATTDQAINTVVSSYVFGPTAVPVDVRVAWNSYRNAVTNATTVAQIKAALTNELGVLLKELLRTRVADL